MFSAALCRGLIEGRLSRTCRTSRAGSFPRLYAAASLKAMSVMIVMACLLVFSAALCRGLIEGVVVARLSARYWPVFRGFMPRPH